MKADTEMYGMVQVRLESALICFSRPTCRRCCDLLVSVKACPHGQHSLSRHVRIHNSIGDANEHILP